MKLVPRTTARTRLPWITQKIDIKDIPYSIRVHGLAPALAADITGPFWDITTTPRRTTFNSTIGHQDIHKLLADRTTTHMASHLLANQDTFRHPDFHLYNDVTANHWLLRNFDDAPLPTTLPPMPPILQPYPSKPTCFSDGSTKHPQHPHLNFGTAAARHPQRPLDANDTCYEDHLHTKHHHNQQRHHHRYHHPH